MAYRSQEHGVCTVDARCSVVNHCPLEELYTESYCLDSLRLKEFLTPLTYNHGACCQFREECWGAENKSSEEVLSPDSHMRGHKATLRGEGEGGMREEGE